MSETRMTAFISMRGERDVGMNDENQLIFRHGLDRINMGTLSQKDIDDLCNHLQRLKIHFPMNLPT